MPLANRRCESKLLQCVVVDRAQTKIDAFRFRKERNELNEQLATIVGCESAKSSEGRQRITESHSQAVEGGLREKEQGRQRRRGRTKSKKILSTPLGNRHAAAQNESAKRMRTRDERAKRERQIDRTSGRLELEEKEGRGRLFTFRRSRRLRGFRPSQRRTAEKRRQGKDEERKNRTNRVSHGESEIKRKEIMLILSCSSEQI